MALLTEQLGRLAPNAHSPPYARALRSLLRVVCLLLDDRLFVRPWHKAPPAGGSPGEPWAEVEAAALCRALTPLVAPTLPEEVARAALLAGALLARTHRMVLAMHDELDSWFVTLVDAVGALRPAALQHDALAIVVDMARQPAPLLSTSALECLYKALPRWLAAPSTQGAVAEQLPLLTLDCLPPTLLGVLGSDLVALVVAQQESDEVRWYRQWSSHVTQSVACARLGLASAAQPGPTEAVLPLDSVPLHDDVFPAGPSPAPEEMLREVVRDVDSLQPLSALAETTPAAPRPDETLPLVQPLPSAEPELTRGPRRPAPTAAASAARRSAYFPTAMSMGGAPCIPGAPTDRQALSVRCLRALRAVLTLRSSSAFSTVQYTQFLHFAAPYLTSGDLCLAECALDLVTSVVGLHGIVNWKKAPPPPPPHMSPRCTARCDVTSCPHTHALTVEGMGAADRGWPRVLCAGRHIATGTGTCGSTPAYSPDRSSSKTFSLPHNRLAGAVQIRKTDGNDSFVDPEVCS